MLGGKYGVIDLKQKQEVIELYMKGLSERKIEKELPICRNTVRKYIKEFKKSRSKDVRNLPIPESITSPPKYKHRVSPKRVLTIEIQEKIQYFISQNEWKKDHYMGKQQMKIIDMHEALLKEGHTIGYTTVRNFVREIAKKNKEVFIRKHPEPGAEIEFDWGEVKLKIHGKLKAYSLAVFTLPYSNYRFARVYESETQVCVLDAHSKLIQHIKFVPKSFTYDNMRTVVKTFIGHEKVIHEQIKNLSQYYHFKIRLCNARKGNEKGSVERSVEYVRRKAFSSEFTFNNIDAANEHLITTLLDVNKRPHHEHKMSKIQLLEKEREKNGITMIQPFDAADLVECRIDKYSTVVINQNHYSVPEGHVGEYCRVKVGAEEIRCFLDNEFLCAHKRSWGLHQWTMDIQHYLETFKKKKGALSQSECLNQAPKTIKNIYNTYYIGKEKDFLALLEYVKAKDNLPDVLKAIKKLEELHSSDISMERIQFICEQEDNVDSINDPRMKNDIEKQSEANLKAYESIFYREGVM